MPSRSRKKSRRVAAPAPKPMHPIARQLNDALNNLPHALIHEGVSGHCDAFALALMAHLTQMGIPEREMALVVVSRERTDHEGTVIDTNALSHVLLEALDTQWDVLGEDAEQRWEDEWIQPDDAEEAEDLFSFDPLTRDELVALRMKQDDRGPAEDKLLAYATWLQTNLILPPAPEPHAERKRNGPR